MYLMQVASPPTSPSMARVCIYLFIKSCGSHDLIRNPGQEYVGVLSHCRAHCNVFINNFVVSMIGAASTIVVETIVLVITWRRTYRIHKEAKALGFPTSFATLLLVDGTRACFPGFRITHPCSLGTVYLLVLILTQTANIASNVTKKVNCLPASSPFIAHTHPYTLLSCTSGTTSPKCTSLSPPAFPQSS